MFNKINDVLEDLAEKILEYRRYITKETILIMAILLIGIWALYSRVNAAKEANNIITESLKKPAQQSPQITPTK